MDRLQYENDKPAALGFSEPVSEARWYYRRSIVARRFQPDAGRQEIQDARVII